MYHSLSPATGEMYPDSGWRLIRANSQLRFVAPVSAAPPGNRHYLLKSS
ncbi:Uncharacterised protein [Klebsiella quasivariicola]|uniref:Uncharacterized protein n=1 Tax=Klebsiella quasivariicola TaxID=2026240 RepID=A0ABY6WZV6_9ENTR|nr:Uncharacterised protein [Klebsiella quasivariicola]